jgi:ATP-binding cassette subfamily B protein
VLVDGVDVRPAVGRRAPAHIGIVLQEPFLFFGTIAENVAYGMPGAGPTGAGGGRAARSHDFVLKLGEGYDALVGRARPVALRRRAPAHRDRPRDPGRSAHPDPRRSDVGGGHAHGAQIQRALDAAIAGRTTIAIAHA